MIMVDKGKSVKEIFRYGVAGATTTLVNIGIYYVLVLFEVDYKLANLIAIICSKIYGYIVNKFFVFKSHCKTRKELAIEIGKYAGARGFTGLVDYIGVFLLVEFIGINKVYSKYGIAVTVIVLNYIFGKFVIFNKSNGG